MEGLDSIRTGHKLACASYKIEVYSAADQYHTLGTIERMLQLLGSIHRGYDSLKEQSWNKKKETKRELMFYRVDKWFFLKRRRLCNVNFFSRASKPQYPEIATPLSKDTKLSPMKCT